MKKDICDDFIKKIIKLLHLKLSKKNTELLVQIFRFSIVGAVATLIDFIFIYIFRDVCNLDLILSNTLSFTISVIYNYIASKTFVFNVDNNKNKKQTFLIFIIFSVLGLGINNIILEILTNVLNLYYLVSKVIATIFVMIFNFITRKKFLE